MTVRIQIVVFMRHGIAVHNIRDPKKEHNHRDPRMWDPPLLHQGILGAVEAGRNVRLWMNNFSTKQPELLITSPLTRCIQTTTVAFVRGNDYDRPPPPIVCVEDVREAYGIYYPDKRREKSKLQVRKDTPYSFDVFHNLVSSLMGGLFFLFLFLKERVATS